MRYCRFGKYVRNRIPIKWKQNYNFIKIDNLGICGLLILILVGTTPWQALFKPKLQIFEHYF